MPRGTTELTRIIRELFDQHNRLQRSTVHSTTVRITSKEDTVTFTEDVVLDDTQPSLTPKWGAVGTWSRGLDNILWSEGAEWL